MRTHLLSIADSWNRLPSQFCKPHSNPEVFPRTENENLMESGRKEGFGGKKKNVSHFIVMAVTQTLP